MKFVLTPKERHKRWQALRRRWPWWRLCLAAACFLAFIYGIERYGITTNVLRSPSPRGTDMTQAIIFLAGLPIALVTGIGPHAREHKFDAFIGTGFVLFMLYLFSLSLAERHQIELALRNGRVNSEPVEFMLTHFEVGRANAQIPNFLSSDGEQTWRPPIVGVSRQHIGQCVMLIRRVASDGTRLVEGQDALTVASFRSCQTTTSDGLSRGR
jgi:hypothetical protein